MNESIRNRFEERLRTRHMMQREFIDRLGVSEVTASRWLNGERNPTMEIFHENGKHSRNRPHELLYKRCCRGNTTGKKDDMSTGLKVTFDVILGLVIAAVAAGILSKTKRQAC